MLRHVARSGPQFMPMTSIGKGASAATPRQFCTVAQVTIEVWTSHGTEIGRALTALAPFPIDVIGMNCGPDRAT